MLHLNIVFRIDLTRPRLFVRSLFPSSASTSLKFSESVMMVKPAEIIIVIKKQ